MKPSILCAAACLLLGTATVQAQDLYAHNEVVVSYGDINLHANVGKRELIGRLDAASAEVCGPAPTLRDIVAWSSFKGCASTAMHQALNSLPVNVKADLDAQADADIYAAR